MRHYRAHRGTDTALTLWVRDDAGKRDMTGLALSLAMRPLGRTGEPLETVAATSPAAGKVTATISATVANSSLGPGLFRMDVVSEDETLQTAILEVV